MLSSLPRLTARTWPGLDVNPVRLLGSAIQVCNHNVIHTQIKGVLYRPLHSGTDHWKREGEEGTAGKKEKRREETKEDRKKQKESEKERGGDGRGAADFRVQLESRQARVSPSSFNYVTSGQLLNPPKPQFPHL